MPIRKRTLGYNDLMPRLARNIAWAPAGYGLAIVLSGVACVRAWRPERSTVDVAVTAATPWLLAPSWALLAGALIARRRRLVVLASALAVYHATCTRPQSRPLGELAEGPVVRVAFANLLDRNPHVRGILSELAAGEHDIVGLAEVTEAHAAEIDTLLPRATYPWRWCVPAGSQGLALISRVPLDEVSKWMSQGHPQLEVTVRAPESPPFRLLVIHTWGPVGRRKIGWWRAQLAEIADRARSAPSSGDNLPVVMVGDFNATRQHRSFDRLVGTGWSDAGALCFGGWRGTWPANRWWRPPLFRIDHILTGPGVSVRTSRAGQARGSDHRPVTALLTLPTAGRD
jgi:endonuclease/exonuclease/phosphatase (EEP) superfamily protein YafD